jgi:hypothetical protein
MSLEVIGAGFGRTGTNSLKVALETLGYEKCHHMKEVIPNRRQIELWDAISRGQDVDWDEVFEGFAASVDWPSSAYYKELAERYPDAKVVLSVRDAEGWYVSVSETIYQFNTVAPRWIRRLFKTPRTLVQMVNRIVWGGVFEGRFEEKEFAIRIFEEHIEEVKRTIPPRRLLVHQAKEGWEPLCAFLGKPVPDTPYPRVNEAKEMKRMIVLLRWIDRLPWIFLGLVGFALALWWL